jgi:L-alanine-DL-glutamate epimerase-like enolase superfamily enzyme
VNHVDGATSPGLRIDRVRVPFRRPFLAARGPWLARESWIIRVRTAAGVGAAEVPIEAGEPQPTTVAAAFADPRLGAAIADAEALAAGSRVIAAAVGVNATLEAAPLDDLVADALGAVGRGFRTLKLKAGTEGTTAELAERVRVLRDVLGPQVRLRLDVNGAWDRWTAIERLAAVAGFDVELVEQPIPAGVPAELAALRARSAVPVAADEAVASVAAAEALLVAGAVDALVVKPARVGGLAAARRVGELAYSAGVPVILSTFFETGVGVGGALGVAAALAGIRPPGVAALDHGLATTDLLEDDLLTVPVLVERGRAESAGGPPDAAAIERYRVAEPLTDGWDA